SRAARPVTKKYTTIGSKSATESRRPKSRYQPRKSASARMDPRSATVAHALGPLAVTPGPPAAHPSMHEARLAAYFDACGRPASSRDRGVSARGVFRTGDRVAPRDRAGDPGPAGAAPARGLARPARCGRARVRTGRPRVRLGEPRGGDLGRR